MEQSLHEDLQVKTWCLDFDDLIEENKEYFETLWDYCTCLGKTPAEIHYPGLQDPIVAHTFNWKVYNIGRPKQMEKEVNLAQISAVGTILK